MEAIYVALCSLGSIIVIFFITKLLGNRQLAQFNMFDYVNGITIGSIAAEMATDLEEFYRPLIGLVIYGVMSIIVALCTRKSLRVRRFMEGKALILYQDNKIYEKNLGKAGIDMDEFLSLCRLQGYFNLQDVHTAFLETTGQISFLPKVNKRPVNTEDLKLCLTQEYPVANVIIDGVILLRNLQHYGKDINWLNKQLKEQDISDIKDIILATCEKNSSILTIYRKTKAKKTDSIFE